MSSNTKNYNPSDAISSEFGIFGLPLTEQEAKLILLPVPWEVTTSYGNGASLGPEIIRGASEQIDLFDLETGKAFEAGYFMLPVSDELKKLNDEHKILAQELIQMRLDMSQDEVRMHQILEKVNQACAEMSEWVYRSAKHILDQNKLMGLVGGDHSTPFGAIRAISEKYQGQFGILHIDAHADLRNSYQGFRQSHASIMYNVMMSNIRPLRLVQLGIRDFCEEEFDLSQSRPDIETFYDLSIKQRLLQGESWHSICLSIIQHLPKNVYISFDIDGLDPQFCPHTGTPVPGGLSVDQVFYLFNLMAKNGIRLVGFDLNEVSSGGLDPAMAEWDGNVGARILYKLCGWSIVTNESN